MSVKQPVKTSIKVDAILAAAITTLEQARSGASAAPVAHGVLSATLESLASTLFTAQQQQQVQTLLTLWKECRFPNPHAA